MSALHLKADMARRHCHVRYVPLADNSQSYCAVQPPSIGIAAPVILCAVGWVSHRTSDPISSGRDVRRLGCFSASKLEIALSRSPPISAARAEICGSMIAVSVQPGQMQLTVIPPSSREPTGAYSSAATRDSPTRPNFAETYGALFTEATRPCTEAMLTTRP